MGIEFLREKLDKAESVTEVDEVRELVAKVKDDVTALLDENEPFRKQRREQEEKKEESLTQARLNELAWVFPCRRDQAKKILDRLVWNDVDRIGSLHHVGFLLMLAEDLEWGDNISDLKPLTTECTNLLKGNWNEAERIIDIVWKIKSQILISGDEDMEKKYLYMLDLLTREVNEHSVEIVFKFNAALSRLADERYVDTQDLLSKETPELVVG